MRAIKQTLDPRGMFAPGNAIADMKPYPSAGQAVTASFATVVLDVDSTLSGIEGIDWLAERRGPELAATIVALTNDFQALTIDRFERYDPAHGIIGQRHDVRRDSAPRRSASQSMPSIPDIVESTSSTTVAKLAVMCSARDHVPRREHAARDRASASPHASRAAAVGVS